MNSFSAEPVVFNEADDGTLVEEGVVNVVGLGVRGDDDKGNASSVTAAALGGVAVGSEKWGRDSRWEASGGRTIHRNRHR